MGLSHSSSHSRSKGNGSEARMPGIGGGAISQTGREPSSAAEASASALLNESAMTATLLVNLSRFIMASRLLRGEIRSGTMPHFWRA